MSSTQVPSAGTRAPDVASMRFSQFAIADPGALAIVDPDGSRKSRQELLGHVNRLSMVLRSRGCGRGTVMALIAPNGADFIGTYLAATQIGMYVVPVNWHLAPAEIQYIIVDSGAEVLVAHRQFQGLLHAIGNDGGVPSLLRISLGGPVPGFIPVEELTSATEDSAVPDPVQGRVLSYTSATTGRPKGVVLPIDDAERALEMAISARIAAGTTPGAHVQLCASMLYHGAPLEGVIIALHMGHSVVLVDRFEPEVVLRAIHEYRATMAYIVPSMFRRLLLLDDEAKRRYSTASLKKVLHGGAACPVDVKRRMIDWWGPIFWEAYGATEGAGTVVGSEDWLKYPGTVGRPIPGTRIRIVGEDGTDAAVGSAGTIYLTRYSGDRFQYLNDPEKTQACHLGDYFTAGDVGFVNAEGFLFLLDRRTDMINLSGMKVYPAEIEDILRRSPHVAECAVLGVDDIRLGENILAVICPADSAPESTELRKQLVRLLRQHVSVAKIPRYFEFMPELPRDAVGKVQKKLLRDRYAAALQPRNGAIRSALP